MRVRNRMLTVQISVLFIFQALCLGLAFWVWFFAAAPLIGRERLVQHLGQIAARYFTAAGVLTLILGAASAAWLSYVARKRVYRPLARLKHAALRIRDGSLDYELPAVGRNDFSELAEAFEDMRIHLRNSMKETERAEQERRAMMSGITHDLRTPVTSILGYSEGILDGVARTPEQVYEYASVIRAKALALNALVEDLALLSVLEEAPPMQLERMELGVWLKTCAEETAAELSARVECETDDELWCVADRAKLNRVIGNLIGNAVKYGRPPDEGEMLLRLTAQRDGDMALVTISDNGPGLPREEARRVFDRFYRADLSRGVVTGSGLGLSIARQIILLHKGKIWLSNREEGGLSANFTLPLLF